MLGLTVAKRHDLLEAVEALGLLPPAAATTRAPAPRRADHRRRHQRHHRRPHRRHRRLGLPVRHARRAALRARRAPAHRRHPDTATPQPRPARARDPGRAPEGDRVAGRDRRATTPRDRRGRRRSSSRWPRRAAGAILTNDYNLNRVAELQGVRVLNVNHLANAVKPAFLPGEELHVRVIQEGKEAGQGVGLPRRRDDDRGRGRRPLPRPRGRRDGHARPPDRRRADGLRPPASSMSRRRHRPAPSPTSVVVAAGSRHAAWAGIDKLAAPLARPAAAGLDARRAARGGRVDADRRPGHGAGPGRADRRRAVARRRGVGGRRRWRPAPGLGRGRRRRARRLGDRRDVVLVHDGARPLVAPSLVDAVAAAAARARRGDPGAGRSSRRSSAVDDGRIVETVDRDGLVAAQTPQGVAARPAGDASRAVRADGAES